MPQFNVTGNYIASALPGASKPAEVTETCCDQCKQSKCCCEAAKPPPWPGVTKLVTNTCVEIHPDTGKPWLVQTCVVWDETCEKWVEKCEGIYELTSKLKAGDTLPMFAGLKEIYTTEGDTVEVQGEQVLPENMVGMFLCINGELCYVANPPAQIIPNEVQVGGDQPPADSDVEVWISNGIHKTQSVEGIWTQSTAFGG